jgi:TolA-binding protein
VTGAAREDCRGDLLAQGRRGALSDAGKLALDAHLAACVACRTARDVWSDFDAVDVVDVRDGARVRALADVVRARSSRRRRARAVRPWAAAAALLLIAGGSASAAVWLWKRPAAGERAALPAAAAPAREARARVAHAAPAPQPAAVAPVETPAPARQPAPRRAPAVAAVARQGRGQSAAELLAAAREARGQGETARATELYRRLQREYPGTPEAVVSTVPLGRVLLAAGSGRAALAQFDGYLRAHARGPLVAEALYGKGQACALLDDVAEERATWQRLLAEHADSPYAPHARRRLASLRP